LPDGLQLAVGAPAAALRGPVANHANTISASPTTAAAMPCLTWCVVAPAACPGKNDGRDFAGSAK